MNIKQNIKSEQIEGLRIRQAEAGDAPLLLSLIRELAEYEKLAHEVTADAATLAESLFCEKPAAEALIAELNGHPVGFALYFHNFSTFLGRRGLYLEDLFVRPDARKLGIGRALLIRLAQIARERGCGRLEWWVLDWNTPALDFYRRLGAQPMSDWTVQRLNRDAIDRLAGETL